MKVFTPFRLDTVNQCLWRAGERVPITPKAFDVLRYLVEHADRLVTQDEILEALWPEMYVNPEGVRKYILEIRKALGDRPHEPLFIQTLPKRGYQFVAKITDEHAPQRSSAVVDSSKNIVGREAAFAQFEAVLDRASSGQRQVIFITGEPGIGKTTLVDVFQQQATRIPNLWVARGQCIEGFGSKEAFYPILEAIGSLLRRAVEDSLVRTLEKQAPTWLAQFPFAVKPEQREWLRQEILGSTQGRMVREICEALEALSAHTTLMLILEDLHWADGSTVDLISVLARRRGPAKLLLIGTYRPVEVVLSQSPLKALKQDLLLRQLGQEISLERLQESHVREYVTKEFAGSTLPDGVAQLIHRHSDGNALFMVGLVRDMVKRGLIVRDGGEWSLTASVDEISPEIPETLQEMLDIQFEQLSAEEQSVLQCCSVAGELFPVWAHSIMLNAPYTAAEEICEKLSRRDQFIRFAGIHSAADGADCPHYEFRHALYRDALYRRLSATNRSEFHLRLGRHLMGFYSAGRPELASEVALHLEKGRDYEQAARCLIVAAENASRRFAQRDSVKVLRQALALVPSITSDARIELEIQALQRIGDVHYAFGAMSESVDVYETAAARAAEAGLQEAHVTVLTQMAFSAWFIEPAKGHQVCNRAMQVSRNLSNPVSRARTELAVACFRLLYDHWTAEDVEVCARAKRVLDESGDSTPYVHHIYVQVLQGEHADALKRAELLINTAGEPAYTLAFGGKGLAYLACGRYGDWQRLIWRGRELSEKNESPGWMWVLAEAWLRFFCFDFEGGRRFEESTMPIDAGPHSWFSKAVARLCAGYAEISRKNYEAALEAFGAVRDYSVTPKFFLHWFFRIQAHVGTVEAHLSADDLANAKSEAAGLLQSVLALADPNLRALAWEINARVAGADQNWIQAREHINHALAVLDTFDIPDAGWRVHRTASKICLGEGDGVAASRHRACAQEMIAIIAGTFDPDEPLKECFLQAPPVRRVLERAVST